MDLIKKKAKRVTQACNYCKLKRVKCTGDCPCQKCITNHIKCVYSESKKRGRKIKFDEDAFFKSFTDACNYLYKGVPMHAPYMNNVDPKYDILINYDLLKNFYNFSTFEMVPFLSLDIINNRIYHKNIHFSLLFGLYAISEIFKPFGDYNVALKFQKISINFLELTVNKYLVNDIQIIETLYIASLIDSGNLKDYMYTKFSLQILSYFNFYNIIVPKYEAEDEEEKKKKNIFCLYCNYY